MAKRTPRERRHARTRQEILNAALELIVEKGADNLSLREIARRVDYSPAGLYEYFGGKDKIIDAVCDQAEANFLSYLQRVNRSVPVQQYLLDLAGTYTKFARENPEEFTFLFTYQTIRREEVEGIPIEDLITEDDSFGIIYYAIQRAINEGVIKLKQGMSTFDITYGLWALLHGMAVLQIGYLKEFPHDFEKADRFLAEAFIRGLGLE